MKKLWLDLEMAGTVGDFVENEKEEKKKKETRGMIAST